MMCSELHERLRARDRKDCRWRGSRATVACASRTSSSSSGTRSRISSGLYGRNAVRAYAVAVGLSPDDALTEVAHRLREPEDPIDGLARVRASTTGRGRGGRWTSPCRSRSRFGPDRVAAAGLALIDSAILIAIDLALLELALVAGVRMGDILASRCRRCSRSVR